MARRCGGCDSFHSRLSLRRGMNVVRGQVVVLDLDVLAGHHAQHVRMVLAALLVDGRRSRWERRRCGRPGRLSHRRKRWPVAAVGDDGLGLLAPLQAGSWLMSILAGLGAAPSNFTVPLMVATVAGSIGVAAGWAGCSAAWCWSAVLPSCCRLHSSAKAEQAEQAKHCPTGFLIHDVALSEVLTLRSTLNSGELCPNQIDGKCAEAARSRNSLPERFARTATFYREPPLTA